MDTLCLIIKTRSANIALPLYKLGIESECITFIKHDAKPLALKLAEKRANEKGPKWIKREGKSFTQFNEEYSAHIQYMKGV